MVDASAEATFDFIIIGGGTNGLTAASYLAKEGLKTVVVERQYEVGGGAITRELTLPGFHHDVIATSINTWRASPVQDELELAKYGYADVDPDPVASTPFKNGRSVTIYKDLRATLKSISQFSKKDAEKFEEFFNFYMESKEVLHASRSSPPLLLSDLMTTLEQSDQGLDFLQFTYLSARDWLEENFESEEMKAFLALWGSNHSPLSPEDSGSAIVILGFIGLLQDKGVGVPIGGMKTLALAFRRFLETHGGVIATGEEVREIIVENGKAQGILTSKGRKIRARKGVIADVEPRSLFLKLVPQTQLDSSFRSKAERFRFSKVSQVMIHAALDDSISYKAEEARRSGMVQIGDSLNQISRAFNDCIIGEMPKEPFMTVDNTTSHDNSRAPSGKHIMWNFVRAPAFVRGHQWTEEEKSEFADRAIERLSEYAPNAKNIVLKRVVLSPQDIQSINSNMVNGDPSEGRTTIDQSMALRPFPRWSQYKTPIAGLYMCRPATHPVGGVSGLCGRNAALVALNDLTNRS
ncbi:MAG: NAD(P)/FAD-dependent oxidoreductase [Nitrososphaerota archaeon]|nr:NAD(P)/FAD-dependent oxidoreductase [Nitrososphaerota archaeon]